MSTGESDERRGSTSVAQSMSYAAQPCHGRSLEERDGGSEYHQHFTLENKDDEFFFGSTKRTSRFRCG